MSYEREGMSGKTPKKAASLIKNRLGRQLLTYQGLIESTSGIGRLLTYHWQKGALIITAMAMEYLQTSLQ